MNLAVFVANRQPVVARWAGLLLAAAGASCGGGPEALQDGAENTSDKGEAVASPVPAAASDAGSSAASDTPSGQPAACWNVATGCRCANEGQVVACQGRRYDFGDYVSCAGERQCVNGTWGPCISTHYLGK